MTEEKKPFTVSDRRLFTSEGERRAPEEPEPQQRELPKAGTAVTTGGAPSKTGTGRLPPVDFAGFLLGLGAQASLFLGQGDRPADLDGAREIISILEMLRDKTEGRRTPEESEVLDGLLYELRMAYLQKTGVSRA
jgi:hypothetical protein